MELLLPNVVFRGAEGRIHLPEMKWQIDVDMSGEYKIRYNFADGSHGYVHKLNNIERLMSVSSYVYQGVMYLFAVIFSHEGLQIIRVMRNTVGYNPTGLEAVKRERKIFPLVSHPKNYVRIEFVRYATNADVNALKYGGKRTWFKRQSGMVLYSIVVAREIYEKGMQHAVTLSDGNFLPKNIYTFLSSWNNQILFVLGARVNKSDKLSADQLLELSTVIWCKVYVARYDQSQTLAAFQKFENEYRAYKSRSKLVQLPVQLLNFVNVFKDNFKHASGITPLDNPKKFTQAGVQLALAAGGYAPRVLDCEVEVYSSYDNVKVEGEPYRYLKVESDAPGDSLYMEELANKLFDAWMEKPVEPQVVPSIVDVSDPIVESDLDCTNFTPVAIKGDGECGYRALYNVDLALRGDEIEFFEFKKELTAMIGHRYPDGVLPSYCTSSVFHEYGIVKKNVKFHIHEHSYGGPVFSWVPSCPEGSSDHVFHLKYTRSGDMGHWDLLVESKLITGDKELPGRKGYLDMINKMNEYFSKTENPPPKVKVDGYKDRCEMKMREILGYLCIGDDCRIASLCDAPGGFAWAFDMQKIKTYDSLSLSVDDG